LLRYPTPICSIRSSTSPLANATVQLIAVLMEVDARRLYLGQGCSSLFTYCTQVLHLSEHAAYGRIEAARAARRFPAILERIADGSMTLTTVSLLAPHLTLENHREVLDAARHCRKREVEELVARLRPQSPVVSSIRKVPTRTQATSSPASPRVTNTTPRSSTPQAAFSVLQLSRSNRDSPVTPQTLAASIGPVLTPLPARAFTAPHATRAAAVTPLAPGSYRVQVTVGHETVEKLRRVQDLLRHVVPNGDLATILDRAVTALLAQVERAKLAATDAPRARGREVTLGSRHIPAAVRRAVWTRDEGRCAFVGAAGRCTERGFLEFHHVVPYAAGGEATVNTIELRCRAHNQYEAALDFGLRVSRADDACCVHEGEIADSVR
jgi:hypothetical protein